MVMCRSMILRRPELLGSLMRGRHTNRSLARRVGCSPSMIGHLRTGARTSCRPGLAERITGALGIPLSTLFVCEPEICASEPGRDEPGVDSPGVAV